MSDAAAELALGTPDPLERAEKVCSQGRDTVWPAVGQAAFREGPDAFVGVQLGRVGGKELEVEAGECLAKGRDGRALVDLAVVPQHDNGAAQVPQQVAEEGADVGLVDVRGLHAVVEAKVAAARADRDAGDDGQLVAALPDPEHRGLPPRRPGLADAGDQQEARFVDEDEVGAQPRSVFFTRGHWRRFHWAMRSSSRSSARVSGFWGLHFSWCISRPT